MYKKGRKLIPQKNAMNITITRLLIIVICSVGVSQLNAQLLPNNKLAPSTNENTTKKLFNFLNPATSVAHSMTPLEGSKKSILLSSNNKFDIYALPLDNMPCLVPNKTFSSNMSTMQEELKKKQEQLPGGKIPNPFNVQKAIPQTK